MFINVLDNNMRIPNYTQEMFSQERYCIEKENKQFVINELDIKKQLHEFLHRSKSYLKETSFPLDENLER